MKCHGQTCMQECIEGARNCSLQCDSKEQCNQICKKSECGMECQGQNCTQECKEGASKCSLQCDSKEQCKQICNKGDCSLVCHGHRCEQECKSGASKCNLQCGSNHCEQICHKGDCTLECQGNSCRQQCNGNQNSCILQCPTAIGSNRCEQNCSPTEKCTKKNLSATKKLTTLAVTPKRTSVHYYPCKHFCTGEWSNCSCFFTTELLSNTHNENVLHTYMYTGRLTDRHK